MLIGLIRPAVVLALSAWALPPSGASGQSLAGTAFVGADVLPMTADTLLIDRTVVLRGETIGTIGPRTEVEAPAGTRVIDAAGLVLMPGLIDAHVHLRDADSTALLGYLRACGHGGRSRAPRSAL